MDCSKKDWDLFRAKIPGWQEAYMDRLNREYVQILNAEGNPSDRFWTLEKRISRDKRNPGVQIQMRKQDMPFQLLSLLRYGVIEIDDLKEFSPELRESINHLLGTE